MTAISTTVRTGMPPPARARAARLQHRLGLLALGLLAAVPATRAQTIDPWFAPEPDGTVLTVVPHPDGNTLAGGHFGVIDGIDRARFAKLDHDGQTASGFANPGLHSFVTAVSLQADGKIVLGGDLTQAAGATRRGAVRLNANGTLDPAFADPQVGGSVYATAPQTDGKLLIAGRFATVGGQARGNLARLNADGSLDPAFAPQVDHWIETLALQPDGKILIGGYFGNVAGVSRKFLARLNANGSLDSTFAPPELNTLVFALALQPDGKILVGGDFTVPGSTPPRRYLMRLHADGRLDSTFADPGLQGWVRTVVLQADGKLLVAGAFTDVAGTPRLRLARLHPDGRLDTGFGDLEVDDAIEALALQPNGYLIVGGRFRQIGGHAMRHLARVQMPDAPVQALELDAAGSIVDWKRSGSSPELGAPPLLYRSTDGGTNWTLLGPMSRVAGGWQRRGIAPLIGQPYLLRAEGIVAGGRSGNSQGRVDIEIPAYVDDSLFSDGFEDRSS